MGGKTRRRFALEPDRESPTTRRRTCRKRFRWTLLDDEEYNGGDEKEVRQGKPVHTWWARGLKMWEVYEPDEWEPPRRKRKFKLTASQREKGAALAHPDPWGPSTADEDDLLSFHVGLLITTDIKGWGPGPLPDNLDLDRKADDVPFNQEEKGAVLV